MEKMKDSGIEWIGQIPESWEVGKIKNYANLFTGNSIKDEEKEQYSDSINAIPYIATKDINVNNQSVNYGNGTFIKKEDKKFKKAPKNSILLCIEGGSAGKKIAYINQEVCFVNKLCCVNSKINTFIKFLYYYLMSPSFTEEFNLNISGLIGGVSLTKLGNFYIHLPSYEEQFKIADFLDRKCSQIDALISLEEKEIEKLKEYKTAVITKAVTKGLNEKVPMKESGIEWIEQVPKSWELKKLKFISNSFYKGNGITKEDIVDNGNTPCVRYGDIYTKYENCFNECLVRTNIEKISSPQYFEHGDVLFTATGELIEEIGKSVVYLGEEKCLAGGDVIVLKHNQNPEFFGYALDSHYARIQKGYGKAKLKVVHTSVFIIGNMYVALPSIEEQDRIAKYLNKKSKEISELIEIKHRKIEELETYKRSMIYEYVTGKKRCI